MNMLSRLPRQTSFCQQRVLPYLQQHVRNAGGGEDKIEFWENVIERKTEIAKGSLRDRVCTELSDDAPRPLPFDGPERDYVNFPRRTFPEKPAPTRLVVVPENWFKFMYSKMGVSGPYTLGLGIFLLFVQKEWFVAHGSEWEHLQAWWAWWYVFTRTQLGKVVCDFMSILNKQGREESRKFTETAKQHRVEAIEFEKEQQEVVEAKRKLFDVRKENVGLQLEAAYRESTMDIYRQVKRRLDYQVEVSKIDARIKQQFMVNWVISQVQQSLAKTSEKDTLKQCITDLNTLAARV